jgi:hypothetical protein
MWHVCGRTDRHRGLESKKPGKKQDDLGDLDVDGKI